MNEIEGVLVALRSELGGEVVVREWPKRERQGSEGPTLPVAVDTPAFKGDGVVQRRGQEPWSDAFVRAVAEVGTPVPMAILEISVAGVRWTLSQRLPGIPLSALGFAAQRECSKAVAAEVSRCHDAHIPGGLSGGSADSPWTFAARSADIISCLSDAGSFSLAELLESAVALLSDGSDEVLCHGDLTLRNVLVTEGSVSGIVDWSVDFMTVGPRELDVATFRVALLLSEHRRAIAVADAIVRSSLIEEPDLDLGRIEAATDWSTLQLLGWVVARRQRVGDASRGPYPDPLDIPSLATAAKALLNRRRARIARHRHTFQEVGRDRRGIR